MEIEIKMKTHSKLSGKCILLVLTTQEQAVEESSGFHVGHIQTQSWDAV